MCARQTRPGRRSISSGAISQLLQRMERDGQVSRQTGHSPQQGRPISRWYAVPGALAIRDCQGDGPVTRTVNANPALAARARAIAACAPAGSLERRAAGCAAAALSATGTIASARNALAGLWQDDVRQDALGLIGQLARELAGEAR